MRSDLSERRAHLPIPIGELLKMLADSGFAIDVQTYQSALTALSFTFPQGLPVHYTHEGVAIIDNVVKERLARVLSPIVVTSPDEQQRFAELFREFDGWPFLGSRSTGAFRKTTFNERSSVRKPRSARFRNLNHIVWQLWLTFLLSSSVYISYRLPDPKIKISQSKNGQSRQISYSYTDESFYPTDSVQWVFSDLSRVTISPKESKIDHTYPGSGSFAVWGHRHGRLPFPINLLLLKRHLVCSDSILSFITDKDRFTSDSTYNPKQIPLVNMDKFNTISLTDWRLILFFIILMIPLTILLFLLFYKRKRIRQKPNNAPPLVLLLPNQEKYIRPNSYLYTWGQKLNQREESERRIVDIKASINHRIRHAGIPGIVFKPVQQKATYLFLVDASSPANQQLYLCRYFSRFLRLQEVELDVFYFSFSPRVCWNEKHYRGIALENLAILYRDRRMVLFSRVENLIDYTTRQPQSWFQLAASTWKQKAIFTYNVPAGWTVAEKTLVDFFLLLPITPAGQLQMAEFFQSEAMSTNESLKQFLTDGENGGYNSLPNEPEQLTPQLIKSTLSPHNDLALNHALFQWACATLLYPEPSWEVTLVIGKALDKAMRPGGILTAENLTFLTTTPWIQGKSISPELREDLIGELEKRFHNISLAALENMLTDPTLEKLPVDSVAYEEKRVRLTELMVRSLDRTKRRKGKRLLTPYLQSGLMKDEHIIDLVKKHVRRNRMQQAAFFILILISTSWIVWLLVNSPANTRRWAREEKLIDSAAYYNNLACYLFTKDILFSKDTTYSNILSALLESRRRRSTFTERYNYLTTVFNRGIAIEESDSANTGFLTPDETKAFDILLRSINTAAGDTTYVPGKNVLKRLFGMIALNPSDPAIQKLIVDSSKTRKPGQYVSPNVNRMRDIPLFEPFYFGRTQQQAQRDSLYNQYAELALLYKGGPKEIEFKPDTPAIVKTLNLRALNELASKNISDLISPTILLGTTYDDLLKYEFDQSTPIPAYENLYIAVECEGLSEPIRYYLRPLTETWSRQWYRSELDDLVDTGNNYVIYFFQYKRLIRQEIRIILTNEQYLEVLNKLQIDDRILTNDFNYFYERRNEFNAITRPKGFDFTKIIKGTKETSRICTSDWWNQ